MLRRENFSTLIYSWGSTKPLGVTAPEEWQAIRFDPRKWRVASIPWIKSPTLASRHLPCRKRFSITLDELRQCRTVYHTEVSRHCLHPDFFSYLTAHVATTPATPATRVAFMAVTGSFLASAMAAASGATCCS